MTPDRKQLARYACLIHERFINTGKKENLHFELPTFAWQRCLSLQRKLRMAINREWRLARQPLRRDLLWEIRQLREELTLICDRLDSPPDNSRHASARDVYADLLTLNDELNGTQVELQEGTLSVTTEPIELDGVFLGEFEIRLELPEQSEAPTFRVVALAPNPAASNEDVTHPHVSDEALCAGEAAGPIRAALQQVRLLDFFTVVAQVLRTYNPDGPFVALTEWDGLSCIDCAGVVADGAQWACHKCAGTLCQECYDLCGECDGVNCYECSKCCEVCDARYCSDCLLACAKCEATTCPSCLNNERCPDCYENEKEEQAASPDGGAPEGQPNPTRPAVQPDAWAKLLYLRDYGETEVGGFGISAEEDLLFIEDVQLVKQVCSWGHVSFDDESVADFFDAHVDLGRRPEQFGRLWLHTHPGDSPLPSEADEATFERVFGRTDWAIMFILAQRGQSYARLRFNVGPSGEMQLPVEIDYSRPFDGCDHRAWEREYLANVTPEAESDEIFEANEELDSWTEGRVIENPYAVWADDIEGADHPMRDILL